MDGQPRVTAELFVRSLASRGTDDLHETTGETLAALADDGVVDHYEVHVWGEAVPVDSDHPIARRVAEFCDWAASNGAELSGIGRRTVGSLVDEGRTVTTLPTMALAEYHDGDLASVTPYERDEVVYTVEDRLGALAESDEPTRDERLLVASD